MQNRARIYTCTSTPFMKSELICRKLIMESADKAYSRLAPFLCRSVLHVYVYAKDWWYVSLSACAGRPRSEMHSPSRTIRSLPGLLLFLTMVKPTFLRNSVSLALLVYLTSLAEPDRASLNLKVKIRTDCVSGWQSMIWARKKAKKAETQLCAIGRGRRL
jgi:hypothetical protein